MLQPSRGTLWVELCQRSKRLAPPLLSQKSTVIAAPAHKQEVIKWPESHQYISSSQALYNDDTIFSSTFINRYCIPCSMYYTYSISCEFYSCSKSSVCNSWQWSCCHATRQCAIDDFALANICVDLKLCLSQSEYEVRKLTSKELQKHGSKNSGPKPNHLGPHGCGSNLHKAPAYASVWPLCWGYPLPFTASSCASSKSEGVARLCSWNQTICKMQLIADIFFVHWGRYPAEDIVLILLIKRSSFAVKDCNRRILP